MPSHRSYRKLFLALMLVGLATDLTSKYAMFRWLYNDAKTEKSGAFETWTTAESWREQRPIFVVGGRYNALPGWLGFTAEYIPNTKPSDGFLGTLQTVSAPILPHVNHGALFGIGGNQTDRANILFAVVSLIAAVAIVIWITRKSNVGDFWLCAALGLILGGTLGNFYDRVVFGGVRDFLYFYKIEWPVFNVADCCLVVGAGILLMQALFVPTRPAASTEGPTPSVNAPTPNPSTAV